MDKEGIVRQRASTGHRLAFAGMLLSVILLGTVLTTLSTSEAFGSQTEDCGEDLFTSPACAAVFRRINRGETGSESAQTASDSAPPFVLEQRSSSAPASDRASEAPRHSQTAATSNGTAASSNEPVAKRAQPDSSNTASRVPRGPDGLPPEPPPRTQPDTLWETVRYQDRGLTEAELLASECTAPLNDWPVIDVHDASDLGAIRATLRRNGNVLVRVHYPNNPEWKGVHEFRTIDVRGRGCVKVLGVNDPDSGKRPTVRNIAALGFSGPQRERPGGLIIENIRISMGDHYEIHGPSGAGNCISWPNSARFVVIRNTVVSKCQHHAFVTSRTYHQYLEIDRSHFEYAGSHLAYIDRVGFAYIHNSTFQSPGWGHALRCIAARCVIDNVHVSNIELDGSIAPKGINPRQPNRTYIGMNPMDLYMVGGEHILKNSTIDYYNPGDGGAWAAQYRARWGIFSTDLGGHDGKAWTYAPYWTQEWLDVQGEPVKPVDLTVSNNTFNCLNRPCFMFLVQSTYPRYTTGARNKMVRWIRDGQWDDWDTMMANAPDEWVWTFSRAYKDHRPDLLRGNTDRFLPARIPVDPEWVERGLIVIENNNTINNPRDRLIRRQPPTRGFCWGFWVPGKEGDECQTPVRQANIIIRK